MPNSGWNTVVFPVNTYDSDGVYADNGAAVIQTRGYYALESCCQFNTNIDNNGIGVGFQFTAGTMNPHYAENSTVLFGVRAQTGGEVSGVDQVLTASDTTPACCYPGDKLTAQAYCLTGATLRNNTNTTAYQGRFVLKFTGYWVAYGT
jgi:hypothetical protein